MECCCGVVLQNIPWWMDKAIAAAAFVIALGITFACYLKEEARRHKDFYGKEDQISKRETRETSLSAAEQQRENEMEAAAMGAYAGDVIVTKTTPFDSTEEPGRYKVMVTHRKKTATPLPGIAQMTPKKTAMLLPSPDSPFKTVLQVDLDKTGRADELLAELRKERATLGNVTKVLESTMESVLEIIEKMTGKSFLVVGTRLDGEKKRIAVGEEHLEDHAEELSLQMKLQLLQPFKASIMAYQCEVARPKLDIPAPNIGAPPETATEHIHTDVTPQMTPMKSTQPQPSIRTQAAIRGETPTTKTGVPPPPPVSPQQKDAGSAQAVIESHKNDIKLSALRKALKSNQSKTKTPRTTVNRSAKKVEVPKESLKAKMVPAQPQSGGTRVKQVSQTKMASKADSKLESKEKISKSKEKIAPFTTSTVRRKINSKEGETATNEEAKNVSNDNSAADRVTNFHPF